MSKDKSVKNTIGVVASLLSILLFFIFAVNKDVDEAGIDTQLVSSHFSVLKVIDGDTIKVDMDGTTESIRLIGIDTPEVDECYYEEATEYLEELIGDEYVDLEFDDTQGDRDRYGRILAYIWIDDVNLNLELIEDGYAHEYTYSKEYRYQSQFQNAEDDASDNLIGLWGNCN